MIHWQYYPKSSALPVHLRELVTCFRTYENEISSDLFEYGSNDVLALLRPALLECGYQVEGSKRMVDKIHVPVLFGRDGALEKAFEADAFHAMHHTVVEVEAGRAVVNYQFLKDIFEACIMHNVEYLCIAVRNLYRDSHDFDKVAVFLDTLYSSRRLTLPLDGILLIGY